MEEKPVARRVGSNWATDGSREEDPVSGELAEKSISSPPERRETESVRDPGTRSVSGLSV